MNKMKSLLNMKQIELDSTYRDRARDSLPADFTLSLVSSGQSIVSADRNGQPIQGRSATDPISDQVVLFPPQNPIGSSQLQWEPLAFFLDTLVDISQINSRNYLPYMYSLPDTPSDLLRLDEVPIAPTISDTLTIQTSTDLPRRIIPLGRADNFYINDYLENFNTGETRKIIGFSYDPTSIILQTVTVVALTVVGSNSYVELELVNDNSIPPSNVDRFYQGKTIQFSNGSSKVIINYFFNNIGHPIVQLDTPLSSSLTMGSIASIISTENWLVRIESPFSADIPFYPAYRDPTLGSNIIYRKIGLFDGDKIFAMKAVRHVNNTIGIAIQTFTEIRYIRSLDVDGLTWNSVITIFTDAGGFKSVGQHDIDVAIIGSNPAIIFSGDSGTATLFYVRSLDTFGDSWPVAATIVPVSVGGNDIEIENDSLIRLQPIPAQGISGTGVPVDAGFPEIAYTDKVDGAVAILRGDAFIPTIWTQDFFFSGAKIIGGVADMTAGLIAPTLRYNNALLADDLMTRTTVTYKATAGYNVTETSFNTDLTGTVNISEGFYLTLDDIASALQTALGINFTVTVASNIFTITNTLPAAFIINTTDLASLFGFTVTPTGSATSHIGDTTESFLAVVDNSIGFIERIGSNSSWQLNNSMTGVTVADGTFQSLASVITTIPIDTDGIGNPSVVRNEPLYTVVWFDGVLGNLQARKQSFFHSTAAVAYIGRLGGGTDVNIVDGPFVGNPLATDMLFPTVYQSDTGKITMSYIQNDSIQNVIFTPDNLVTKTPYTVATATDLQVFTSLVNFSNLGAFIAFQEAGTSLYAMVPITTPFDIGVQYRIRDGIAEASGDSSTILDGSTTTIRLASSLTSNVDGFYNGSFIWVYNEVVNPIPSPFQMFNDYRQIVAYNGTTHTATVASPFSASIATTLMENFFLAPDRITLGTGATSGLTDTVISSRIYLDLTDLITELESELQLQDATFAVTESNGIVTIFRATDFEVSETTLSEALGFVGSLDGSNSYTGDFEANFVNSVQWEILLFAGDNFFPLVYNGTMVSVNQPVCYEIELLSLVLPNITLSSGNGNRIAFYPYVYVEFQNLTQSQGNFISYTNNPNAEKTMFRVPITNIVDPVRSTFVALSARGSQSIPFKPNDTFHFKVTLPNGELFQTLITDTSTPFLPDPNLQISAIFGIKRLVSGSGCGV